MPKMRSGTPRRKTPLSRRLGQLAVVVVVLCALVITALNVLPDRRELRMPVESVVTTSSPEFLRTITGLFGSSLETGNQIDILQNGDEIFPAMLDAITAAQHSINFETYTASTSKPESSRGL